MCLGVKVSTGQVGLSLKRPIFIKIVKYNLFQNKVVSRLRKLIQQVNTDADEPENGGAHFLTFIS